MKRLIRPDLLLYLSLACLLLVITQSALRGQDPKPDGDTKGAPAASAEKKPPQTLLELIEAGGPINMGFLAALGVGSVIGVAVTLERLVNLRAEKVIPYAFIKRLRALVEQGEDNPEPYRELCRRFACPISSILKAGLVRAGRPVLEVEKGMEDCASREMGTMRSSIRPLTVLTAVAPMIGLLGTVVGMIVCFWGLAYETGAGRANILSEGIYTKLQATTAGLLVAIPSLIAAAWFNSRIDKHMRRIDERITETIPCFVSMAEKSGVRNQGSGVRSQEPEVSIN